MTRTCVVELVLCTYQNYPKPGDLTRLFDTAYLECELQQEFRCPRIRFVRNTPFAWLRIISLIGPVLVNGMRAIINQHAHSSCQFCFWLKSWRWNHLELATRTPICDWWFSNSVIFFGLFYSVMLCQIWQVVARRLFLEIWKFHSACSSFVFIQ